MRRLYTEHEKEDSEQNIVTAQFEKEIGDPQLLDIVSVILGPLVAIVLFGRTACKVNRLTKTTTDLRCCLQEASSPCHQGDPRLRYPGHGTPAILQNVNTVHSKLTQTTGHQRCPPRPSIEQARLGSRHQGRPLQTPRPHLKKA
jgi:hypothetical protein